MTNLASRYLSRLASATTIPELNEITNLINRRHPVGTICVVRLPSGSYASHPITRGILGTGDMTSLPASWSWRFKVDGVGLVGLDDIIAFENESIFIEEDHSKLVSDLAKPGADIVASMTPEMAHLWHMATLISGEAGELLDAVKKAAIYGRTLDLGNVTEELGDIEFGLRGLRDALGLTREEVLGGNISKLSKRYPSGKYTNEHAKQRLDKAANEAPAVG